MKRLEGLAWKAMWTSQMGCIQGCLRHLGVNVSDAWLFGASGHAFVIDIHPELCPSGPTAWHERPTIERVRNVGGQITTHIAVKTDPRFQAKQREAWDATRAAIDEGIPCFGWELLMPEHYVINGYYDESYLYSGPCPGSQSDGGSKVWRELGVTDIGVLCVARVDRCTPADDATTVRAALELAVEFADSPAKWTWPAYRSGLPAYDPDPQASRWS